MKLKANKFVYELDIDIDVHAPIDFIIWEGGDPEFNPNAYAVRIARLPMHQIIGLTDQEKNIKGRPNQFYIINNNLIVYPVPDKEYHAELYYSPPRKKL